MGGSKKFALKGNMQVFDIKLERGGWKINMACQVARRSDEDTLRPISTDEGWEDRGGSLHEWQHQSQCQTEVETVQTQKQDYCFEPPTPPSLRSADVYS